MSHVRGLGGLNRLVEELTGEGPVGELTERAGALLDAPPAELEDLEVGELIGRLRERHRLSEVLIRNRRAVIGGFLRRRAFRWDVDLTEDERAVQSEMGLDHRRRI